MFNKEAEVPEGWREDFSDSISMEDLVMPMKERESWLQDLRIIFVPISNSWVLTPVLSTHAHDIPEGYLNKNLDNLNVTTLPEKFMMPAWAGGDDDGGDQED